MSAPLYYSLVYPWIVAAGNSEFALRFFSVFFGVLLIPLLYWLGSRFLSTRMGMLLALIGVWAPYGVAYSREARMYTLVPVLAILSVSLLLLVLRDGGKRAWAGWFVVGLLGYVHALLLWLSALG